MKKRLIDLHIHSNFSDGTLSIPEIVDFYGQKGFSAIAITDHLADSKTLNGIVARKLKLSLSEKNMNEYLETIEHEAKRAWSQYSMRLIAGVEVTLNSWSRQKGAHVVFLNVDRFINPDVEIVGLLKQNRDFFSIAAHPLWEESYEFKTTFLWDQRHELHPYLDAWECATAQKFSQKVFLSGYPVVASSDFHSPARFESWKTQIYTDDISVENILLQIKNKNIEPVWI